MILTFYSFVTATLWFTAFILLGTVLQRKSGILFCCQLAPLLLLLTLTVVRMVMPVELPFAHEVGITAIYPDIWNFLFAPRFTLGVRTAAVIHVLMVLWGLVAVILCGRLALRIRLPRP